MEGLYTKPSIHCVQDLSLKQSIQFLTQGIQTYCYLNDPGTHLKQIPPSRRILSELQTHCPFTKVLFCPQLSPVVV